MPLDEMTDYRVHVTPQDDGSLEITYSYEWKVLNDSREGPLSWVKLGMANPNYVVKEFGGAAGGIRYQPSESSENPMLELNLDRSYYKGETARLSCGPLSLGYRDGEGVLGRPAPAGQSGGVPAVGDIDTESEPHRHQAEPAGVHLGQQRKLCQ